jgi:hypothetical protein
MEEEGVAGGTSLECRTPERKRVRCEGEKEWVAAAVEGK